MFAIASSSFAIIASLAAHCPGAPGNVALAFVGENISGFASQALAEAARVWAPYGVSIERVGGARAQRVLVHVRTIDSPLSDAADGRALGSIEFHDGVPDPVITLYPQRAWALIAQTMGTDATHWPVSYRELMIARVLGRALAHELGHFLLQTRGHSASGLMRASQPVADLIAADKSMLALSAADVAILHSGNNCATPNIIEGRTHS